MIIPSIRNCLWQYGAIISGPQWRATRGQVTTFLKFDAMLTNTPGTPMKYPLALL